MQQPIFTNQVYDSFETYLSKKDYESSSDIVNILKSPKHYLQGKEPNPEDEGKEKVAFLKGSAVHCLVQEGEKEYYSRYAVLKTENLPNPSKDLRNAENKKYKADFISENMAIGKKVIDDDMHNEIVLMTNSILKNPTAVKLYQYTIRESSFYLQFNPYSYGDTTIKARIRPDAISEYGGYYISLKTARRAAPNKYNTDFHSYRYNVKEMFYLQVLQKCITDHRKPLFPIMIVVETEPPYNCCVFDLNGAIDRYNNVDEFLNAIKQGGVYEQWVEQDKTNKKGYCLTDTMESAASELVRAYDRLITCYETGVYKGYEIESDREDGIMPLRLPAWARYDIDNQII